MTSYLAAAAAGVASNGGTNGVTSNEVTTGTEIGVHRVNDLRASSIPNSCSPIEGDFDDRRGSQTFSSPSHSYANAVHNYINSPIYNGSVSNNPSSALDSNPSSRPVTSCSLPGSGITDVNTNYAKLDDLVRYYQNINTPITSSSSSAVNRSSHGEVLELTQLPGQQQSSSFIKSSTNFAIKPTIAPSPRLNSRLHFPPTAAQSGMNLSPSRTNASPSDLVTTTDGVQCNYILLDLDKSTDAETKAHIVSTCPATPVSKTPKGGDTVWPTLTTEGQPSTPTSIGSVGGISSEPRLPYAMIDFDKTEALTSAANQRKALSTEVTSS
jgi:hypothetical protein